MTEMIGEYTAVLTRVTELLRGMSFGGLRRNLRFASTTISSSDSASFLVYFWSYICQKNKLSLVHFSCFRMFIYCLINWFCDEYWIGLVRLLHLMCNYDRDFVIENQFLEFLLISAIPSIFPYFEVFFNLQLQKLEVCPK